MPAGETTDSTPRRPAPRTQRGIRTRDALVVAAREVFERDGFLDAKISDIARTAGAASGSFYTYFDSKDEIFAAVVERVQEEMVHPHVREHSGVDDPRILIDLANREYLQRYEHNARLMAVLEQVSQIDERFRAIRLGRSMAFAERNARLIRKLQEQGKADSDVDPEIGSLALSAMMSRMAYLVYVYGHDIPFERLVTNLNRLWYNALNLRAPTEPPTQTVDEILAGAPGEERIELRNT
ncbi:TetR/AcrR family transcriptional regulator [Streptomyces sp. NPDC050549]|uniref:TetR/AcrR family transcriptional regulator n=1 Tax=Streptomyces sp. NPDC050549 TaxID=3155406 RepID=UPI003412DC75